MEKMEICFFHSTRQFYVMGAEAIDPRANDNDQIDA